MKQILPILLSLLMAMPMFAQYGQNNKNPNAVWQMVTDMPQFKGGDKALIKYLQTNVHYPEDCVEQGIEGTAICQFIVEKDGTLSHISLKESSGNATLDAEALRVIQAMPKWKAGKQEGKPVRVAFQLPISFRLQ